MSKVSYETVVHKANIPLAAGESIGQFLGNLGTAIRAHATKKLSSAKKNLYPYLVETYSDSCIIDCYIPGDGNGGSSTYKYYATPYTRDDDGTFNFGAMVEVQPVKTFQPVGGLPIASNTTGISTADASTIEATKTQKSNDCIRPNWGKVEKNLFSGLL